MLRPPVAVTAKRVEKVDVSALVVDVLRVAVAAAVAGVAAAGSDHRALARADLGIFSRR